MPDQKKLIEALDAAIEETTRLKSASRDSSAIVQAIQKELVGALSPVLSQMVGTISESLKAAIKEVKMDAPNIAMPNMEVDMAPVGEMLKTAIKEAVSGLKIEVASPSVNVRVPDVQIPPISVPSMAEVMLKGVNAKSPLPVLLHGTDGKPLLNFMQGSTAPRANTVTVKNILTAIGDSVMDDTNDAIRVNMVASTGTLNVAQVSGNADSVNVIQFAGTNAAVNSGVANDGTLRIVHAADVAMSVNVIAGSAVGTEYNDGATPDQAGGIVTVSGLFDGGSVQSWIGSSYGIGQVQLSGFDGSLLGITSNALDVNIAADAATLGVKQVSGAADSVQINSSDVSFEVKQVSGAVSSIEIASQPFTLDVKQVSGSIDSVNIVSTVTLDIKQVSGSEDSVNVTQLGGAAINLGAGTVSTGTLRVVTGSDSTVMVVGDVASDAADSALGPVKIGGIARTGNPTAVAAGDRVSATYDDLGRQVMRTLQIRDLIQTAYATLSNGSETTLLASASGVFSDLIYIMGANDSGAAVQVDIRAATGANKVMTIEIPANGTAGVSIPVPIPQDVAADTWTADMPDITGTNVYISALFSKEV